MFRSVIRWCTVFLCTFSVFPIVTVAQQATANGSAVVPLLVNYSGVLTGPNGKPLTGTAGVTFSLYKDQEGGAPLWLETQNVQLDKTGHYSVQLGAASSQGLSPSLFAAGEARWLGVQADNASQQPRTLLMSVPYALKALDAETIGGKPASAFMLAPAGSSKSAASGANQASTITGNGTADYLPMFTGTTTIGNSKVYQTPGGDIGIGTTSPAATLDVKGKGDIRDTLTLFPKSTDPALKLNGSAFQVSNTGKVTFVAGQTFPGTGTVTSVGSGAGLTGGPITGSGTLSIKSAGVTNSMLQNPSLTVTANGPLTGGGSVALGGSTSLGLKSCSANQILEFVGSVWTCVAIPAGTVNNVAAGTDIVVSNPGGPTATVNLDTTKVPQLAAANSFTNNNAISVSSGDDLDLSNSGFGSGVNVAINGGYGITVSGTLGQGFNANVGGDGAAFTSTGADGSYNLGGGGGVYSESDTDYNYNTATYGYEFGSTQETYGVWGYSASGYGAGVLGQLQGGSNLMSGVYPIAGVWGDTNGLGKIGVSGTADNSIGVDAENNSPSGLATLNVVAFDGTNNGAYMVNFYDNGFNQQCLMSVLGTFTCTGGFTAMTPVDGGKRDVALTSIAAAESWFEDAGSGQLSNGETVVNLEGLFGQTVNTGVDYHVFLTPNGDCKGLYVAQKSPTSFVVRELGGGTSSIAFDYRIMAKRKGYEQVRLPDVTNARDMRVSARNMAAPRKASRPTPQELRQKHAATAAHHVARLNTPSVNKVN